MGRQLLTRFKLIQNENEDLGKEVAEGKINKLEVAAVEHQDLIEEYAKLLQGLHSRFI
jgi:hypothetical protein